jgi:hypothetical protein
MQDLTGSHEAYGNGLPPERIHTRCRDNSSSSSAEWRSAADVGACRGCECMALSPVSHTLFDHVDVVQQRHIVVIDIDVHAAVSGLWPVARALPLTAVQCVQPVHVQAC